MAITIEKENCCGCYACAQICPKNCIEMSVDSEGFWYPKVDKARCVQCGLCDKVCPVRKEVQDKTDLPSAWACINCDTEERTLSSSGGIFSLLAKQILHKGGVVFGAAFTKDFRAVEHIAIEREEDLKFLRGSKYLQSRIGNTYSDAKKYLQEGRQVLFSGTPCQIGGLKTFLGKAYSNLLCVDIVCHGVPSPKVWNKYVTWQEERIGEKLCGVRFRSKKNSWKNFEMVLDFLGGKTVDLPYRNDEYYCAFLQNMSLRPSCSNCSFKRINRDSDLTLADFWGIQEVCPEMDDDQGTSLVVLHTRKGEDCFREIQNMMRTQRVLLDEAIRHNTAMIESVTQHPKREQFLNEIDQIGFDQAVKHAMHEDVTFKSMIYDIIRRLGLLPLAKRILGRE